VLPGFGCVGFEAKVDAILAEARRLGVEVDE
jgi:hypothetical protein